MVAIRCGVFKQLSELILARGPGLLQCRGQPVGKAKRKRKGLAFRDPDERNSRQRRRLGRGAHLIEAHIEVDGLEVLLAGELFRWSDEQEPVVGFLLLGCHRHLHSLGNRVHEHETRDLFGMGAGVEPADQPSGRMSHEHNDNESQNPIGIGVARDVSRSNAPLISEQSLDRTRYVFLRGLGFCRRRDT